VVPPPHVRVMHRGDIPDALALTATEHWGYTAEDFERLRALEPEGCLLLEYDRRTLAIATATTYGPVAWMGAVVVHPEWRGKGAGRQLLEGMLAFCDSRGIRSARLNSYPSVVPFYEKLGFRRETENARYTASGVLGFSGGRARRAEDLGALADFDARFFGASRRKLLDRLATEPGGFVLAVERGDRVLGYVAGTVSAGGCEIGPWVVEPGEPVAAATLLEEALGLEGVTSAGLTVPLVNHPAVEAVEAAGFREAFRTVRMTRGDPAAEDPRGLWALGGLEKG